jgi:hypothetical protein
MSIDYDLETPTDEEIILYFDVEAEWIDAQTFGNALISFDELYRAINFVINPGLEVEIEFIRSDQGSIRAVLKSIKKDTKTLLGAPFALIVFPFLINILSSWVMSESVKVVVNDDSYIVEHGNERIVLPRHAEQKAKRVESDPSVRRSVRKLFSVVETDANVRAMDFRTPTAPEEPVIPIDRDKFAVLREIPDVLPTELLKHRQQPHYRQTVVVITAVLEKTRRKRQFLWNSHRISADIHDENFFDKLAQHEYEFGQGDTLVVDLIAEQELNEIVQAYETKTYHVTKVHSHHHGPKQPSML